MLVEATLDFPEEEIDFLQKADARASSSGCRRTLAGVMQRPARARCCAKASRW
jgi:tRNA modification GTPase